jgi:hypothetical protein
LDEGKAQGKCAHAPLTEERDKPWLKKNASAHNALTKIMMDKRFLNTLPYYTNFRFVNLFYNSSYYLTIFFSCICTVSALALII